jgi:hypothetical protein
VRVGPNKREEVQMMRGSANEWENGGAGAGTCDKWFGLGLDSSGLLISVLAGFQVPKDGVEGELRKFVNTLSIAREELVFEGSVLKTGKKTKTELNLTRFN